MFIVSCSTAPIVHEIIPSKENLAQYQMLEIDVPENDISDKINSYNVNSMMEKSIQGIFNLKHFKNIIPSEEIALNYKLSNELKNLNSSSSFQLPIAVLKTKLVQFDEGSSFMQFMFGTGNAKIIMELTVINKETQKEILKVRREEKISTVVRSVEDVIEPSSNIIVKFVRSNFTDSSKYN
jgi:hypothetical protein